MRYAQHRSSKRTSVLPAVFPKKSVVLILVAVVIAVALILLLRPNAASKEIETTDAEDPEAITDAPQVQAAERSVPDEDVVTFEETDLFYPDSRSVVGFARRGTEGGIFTHVIVANLPAIDLTTGYYEAWLVKPGVTDFFSTGELFAREDGKFGLIWDRATEDVSKDILNFNHIVITREVRDGNPAPSATHVAEGEF